MAKEVLIFLHGGGVDQWMWDNQIQAFTDYECFTPTLQGHGIRSDEDTFSIRQQALEIIEYIDDYFPNRTIHLVGFSIGSQIALDMIHLRPYLIQTAMINSALVIPQKRLVKWIPRLVKWAMPLMRFQIFHKLQAAQLGIPKNLFSSYLETTESMNAHVLIGMLEENLSFSLPTKLDQTSTKVFITVGAKERHIMKQSAKLITEANPAFQSLTVLQVGHHFPLSHPSAFNQLLRTWLTYMR